MNTKTTTKKNARFIAEPNGWESKPKPNYYRLEAMSKICDALILLSAEEREKVLKALTLLTVIKEGK